MTIITCIDMNPFIILPVCPVTAVLDNAQVISLSQSLHAETDNHSHL